MKNNDSRIHRLLRLIEYLQNYPGHTAAEIAGALGISRRTVFRDLKALIDAGIPVDRRSGFGYRLGSASPVPASSLTPEETQALSLLPRSLVDLSDQPPVRLAMRALEKVLTQLPEDEDDTDPDLYKAPQNNQPDIHEDSITFRLRDTGIVNRDAEAFTALDRAIRKRCVCSITYQPAGVEPETEIVFEPYHLYFWTRSWYVIGRCQKARAQRMLKLTRIQEISLTSETFICPSRFSPREYLGNAWGLVPSGPDTRVAVRFSPRVARNVREVQWHPTQKCVDLPDGSLYFEVVVSGIDEIAWWIAGYGDQVIVLEPSELRERFQTLGKQIINLYANNSVKSAASSVWSDTPALMSPPAGASTKITTQSNNTDKSKQHTPDDHSAIGESAERDIDIIVRPDLHVGSAKIRDKSGLGEEGKSL